MLPLERGIGSDALLTSLQLVFDTVCGQQACDLGAPMAPDASCD